MQRLGSWERLERRIEQWWTTARVNEYVARRQGGGAIIAADGPDALRTAAEQGSIDAAELSALAGRIRRREFDVLGAPVPKDGPWPWHSDWRWQHSWSPAYFKRYRHYAHPRPRPYDVKLPWELARLGFVPPLMQADAIDPSGRWSEAGLAIVEDWARSNPLAHSLGWDPMEASMRAIALVMTAEMASVLEVRHAAFGGLLRELAAHGEFVWRTLEYTDVRGNHYTANLTALLLLGLTLDDSYPAAERWWRFAAKAIGQEAELQLLPDGVDFEKSLSYHRLVTELFVLDMIAMDRAGLTVPPAMRERLHAACTYSAACTRPDGLTPNVGDNDSARALTFDATDPRDHRPLIGLGALVFDDGALKETAAHLPLAAPWFWGHKSLADWAALRTKPSPGFAHFKDGGVIVARGADSYLWFDVGEVGLAGRGGHGHNDLLSFELVLEGVPVVVDAGCPVYTADLATRDLFRSTAYHNGLRIDQEELAPMWGWWWIGDDAKPTAVSAAWDGVTATAEATHGGYERLPDPVRHRRCITFSPRARVMECVDSLRCRHRHRVERYLHLASDVAVTPQAHGARLAAAGRHWALSWPDHAELRVEEGTISPGYGVSRPAPILVLTGTIEGDTDLRFTIAPIHSERVGV